MHCARYASRSKVNVINDTSVSRDLVLRSSKLARANIRWLVVGPPRSRRISKLFVSPTKESFLCFSRRRKIVLRCRCRHWKVVWGRRRRRSERQKAGTERTAVGFAEIVKRAIVVECERLLRENMLENIPRAIRRQYL